VSRVVKNSIFSSTGTVGSVTGSVTGSVWRIGVVSVGAAVVVGDVVVLGFFASQPQMRQTRTARIIIKVNRFIWMLLSI
jgi:hypothetical protein